jgi:oligopeptide/dipeptide ABC transporter ATP-binding protein
MMENILEIQNLKTYYQSREGDVKAVDGVDLAVKYNESYGVIGESGSGKSTLSLSILRLVPHPGKIVEGKIMFEGRDLLKMTDEEIRHIRGGEIAMVFQDPMSSLNPVLTIGYQLGEAIKLHQDCEESEVEPRMIDALKSVGITHADRVIRTYPHELSGGMRQRVMIAMAISCLSKILIADEATTNLDVTIQAQILDLIRNLKEKFEMSIIVITHDLGVIAENCDRVAVMYAGKVMEIGRCSDIFYNPLHPYTSALIKSFPHIEAKIERFTEIRGNVPRLIDPPEGCRFISRCDYSIDVCSTKAPSIEECEKGHWVACYRAKELELNNG